MLITRHQFWRWYNVIYGNIVIIVVICGMKQDNYFEHITYFFHLKLRNQLNIE